MELVSYPTSTSGEFEREVSKDPDLHLNMEMSSTSKLCVEEPQDEPDEITFNKCTASIVPGPLPVRFTILNYILIMGVVIGSCFLAKFPHGILPEPIMTTADLDIFVAGNARFTLDKLTSFGPRRAGSVANEVTAVNLMLTQLEDMNIESSNNISITYEKQTVSGECELNGWKTQYVDVQNIVVRLSEHKNNSTALLVNCHFDSVMQGPGASDDMINCAVMMEVIRVIVNSQTVKLEQDVIFLFNGAEESGLLGSHGFVTQHKWAGDVKALINLEAVGSGGKELLFQSTSKQLMDAYIASCPHPFANIIAQEVFQSGILPSDTDFRIFRDFGNITGLDFAFIESGYVYHTIYDTSARIPDGSLQYAGDNLLSLVVHLASSKTLDGDTDNSDLVFFDMFGLFMVSYPSWVGILINIIVILIAIMALIVDIFVFARKWEFTKKECMKAMLFFSLTEIIIISSSLGFSSLTGYVLGKAGLSMAWFTNQSTAILLYSVPTVALTFIILSVANHVFISGSEYDIISEIFYFHTVSMIHCLILFVLTCAEIGSSFLFAFPLFFNMIWWSTVRPLHRKYNHFVQWIFYITYLLLQIIPIMMWYYVVHTFLTVFIPILGRFGTSKNPDIMLGVLISLVTIIIIQFILPIVLLIPKKLSFSLLLILAFILSIIVISSSCIGFPYSADFTHPSPKRLTILHTNRTFYDQNGEINRTDSGYLTIHEDYQWPTSIETSVPEYTTAHWVDGKDCQFKLGCGFPQWRPGMEAALGNVWVNGSSPQIPTESPEVKLCVISDSVKCDNTHCNITMEIDGPNEITLLMKPYPNVKLIKPLYLNNWGVMDNRDILGKQFVRGLNPGPIRFTISVSGWTTGESLMDASVTGNFVHGAGLLDRRNDDFLSKHPAWTTISAWVAQYKYYSL